MDAVLDKLDTTNVSPLANALDGIPVIGVCQTCTPVCGFRAKIVLLSVGETVAS
jgi:hypothetical protein